MAQALERAAADVLGLVGGHDEERAARRVDGVRALGVRLSSERVELSRVDGTRDLAAEVMAACSLSIVFSNKASFEYMW